MRDPREYLIKLEEKHEVLTPEQLSAHEHTVSNWVWGTARDGHMWQVGECDVCEQDVTRNGTTTEHSAWVVMP